MAVTFIVAVRFVPPGRVEPQEVLDTVPEPEPAQQGT